MTNRSIQDIEEMGGAKYINPYTDFGFKKLFGTPLNKDLLISFLNSLFEGKEVINDLTYLNGENLGNSYGDRRAIFDVYCENEKGETFIVEMQKAEQQFFKDRSVFYSTFPIQNQGKKGIWDFKLKGVYTVGILDFVFPDNEYPKDSLRHEVKLVDVDDKHVFYDKLTFLYLEMPKFTKKEEELKQAEIARYTPEERQDYEDSLKVYRDMKNVLDTAELKGMKKGMEQGMKKGMEQGMKKGMEQGMKKGMEQGMEKGIEQGASDERKKNAKAMKTLGLPLEAIAKVTGMPIDDIEKL